MRRRFVIALLLAAIGSPGAIDAAGAGAGSRNTTPAPADTLATLLARWSNTAGGNAAWKRRAGTHLVTRTVIGGIAGEGESWITADGARLALREGDDHSETVRRGASVWWHDWNGRTRALQGRDRADGVTDAFLRALVFAGPAGRALDAAHARDAGADSTRTRRRVQLAPRDGVPCELELDDLTGLPVSATRRPYADAVTIRFEDWRDVDGVKLPFRLLDVDREGNIDTTWVTTAAPIATSGAPRFEPPANGPGDVRFEHGDRALGIPFDFSNDHIMIEGRVNGSKPLWFLLDTGADFNVINLPRLKELGLTGYGATTTSGGGGSTGLAYTRVDSLRVGGVTLLGQRDGVVDLSGLERLYGMPMGGLLGMDFIDRFTLVVDYDRRVLDLYTPGRAGAAVRGTRVLFIIEEGHPHARGAIVANDGPAIPADFIIDSGAAESANLTSPFVREHRLLERARRTPAPAATTIPGTEKQWFTQTSVRGRLREIRVGAVSVHDVPVNLQQGTTGAYASPSFSGTIGERILSRFNTTYDYRSSAMYLAPNASAAKPFEPRTTFGLSLMADGEDYTHFTVIGVGKGSPADSAGFRKGDVIAALDDRPAATWRLATLRRALSESGAHHAALVQRADQPDLTLDFTVSLVSIEDR